MDTRKLIIKRAAMKVEAALKDAEMIKEIPAETMAVIDNEIDPETIEVIEKLLNSDGLVKTSASSLQAIINKNALNNSNLPFVVKAYGHLVNRLVPKTNKFLHHSNFAKDLRKLDYAVTNFDRNHGKVIGNILDRTAENLKNYLTGPVQGLFAV